MAGEYEDVAASVTNQQLGGSGTQKGQHLSHLIIFPANTSPGAVTLKDGASEKVVFPGGVDSVSNLIPFVVFFAIDGQGDGFFITTGANVSVRAVGDFS